MNTFTATEKDAALDFAYGMGLARPEMDDDRDSALSFAYSMGLRREENKVSWNNHHTGRGTMVPQLQFV